MAANVPTPSNTIRTCRSVNRIRVQLADGRAVLYVNGQRCLDHSDAAFHPQSSLDIGCLTAVWPSMKVRVGNVRIRKWDPTKGEGNGAGPIIEKLGR